MATIKAVSPIDAASVADAELVALLADTARGDERALEVLYRKLSRRIYAFAVRRLSAVDAAEEVVVETMYEVWRHAGRYNGQARVTTWVLGIARHKLLDKLRQRGVQQMEEIEDHEDSMADTGPGPYEQLAQKQRAEQVKRCMETLPDVQRECLHLVFTEELGLAEIALVQDCPENTIKTRLFHARRKMRECIERQVRWGETS